MSEHDTLAAALVSALADLTVVETNRTAKIPTKNGGEYSYKYADIGDVVKLTRGTLAEHGLVALTPVHAHGDDQLACTVTLLHVSGERLDLGPFPFEPGRDAQATGSAVTYHRRYALVAALGLAAGDEDDGASAQPRERHSVDDAEPTVTTKEASEQFNAVLAQEVPQSDLADVGRKVWEAVNPRIVGRGRIPQSELDRLLAAATAKAAEWGAAAGQVDGG